MRVCWLTIGMAVCAGSAQVDPQPADLARIAEEHRKAITARPNDAFAWQGLGVAEAMQGRYPEAISALEKATTLDSGLWGASLHLGIAFYRSNRFEEAKRALEQASRVRPDEPAVRYWLGAAYHALRRYPEAIRQLRGHSDVEATYLLARSYAEYAADLTEQLLRAAPDSPEAARIRAEDALESGSSAAAIDVLRSALAITPRTPGLHLDLGRIHWDGSKYQEAADEFRAELRNDQSSFAALFHLSAYLMETGKPAEARGYLETALRQRPGDKRSLELMELAHGRPPAVVLKPCTTAACWFEREEYAKAFEVLTPQDAPSRYLLAKTCQALSRSAAEEVLSLKPGSARAHLMRGEAFERSRTHEYPQALAEYQKALQVEPGLPGARFALGRTLWKMGRHEEAVDALRSELKLNPNHGAAHYYLGRALQSLNLDAEAADELRKAAASRPGWLDALRALGKSLTVLGLHSEAVTVYRDAVASAPADAGLHALLAAAYRSAGDLEQAALSFEKSRRLSLARHGAAQ